MTLINLPNLSALLAFFVVIAGLSKKENQKNKYLIVLGISICLVSIIDNCNQTKTSNSKDATITSLNRNLIELKADRKTDSINDANFRLDLLKEYHIKDSANKPVFIGKQLNINDNHGNMRIKL